MDLDSPALGAIRRTSAVDTVRARIWLGVDLGMLAAGQRLPTPAETARAFGVSEMTARRAYRLLSDEGLVVRLRGGSGGSFIAEVLPEHGIPALAAYREDAQHVHDLIDQRVIIAVQHFVGKAQDERLPRGQVLPLPGVVGIGNHVYSGKLA